MAHFSPKFLVAGVQVIPHKKLPNESFAPLPVDTARDFIKKCINLAAHMFK